MSGAKRAPRKRTRGLEASKASKRQVSAILEVLGGLRSPGEAAEILGISPQRYYKLEQKAVQGMLAALEATPARGRQPSPESELARVVEERDRLRRELLRAQSLVRQAQRVVGLPPKASAAPTTKPKGKRKRAPRVRARRLAAELRRESEPAPQQPAPATPPPAPTPADRPRRTARTSAS